MKSRWLLMLAAVLTAGGVGGCGGHYAVTDPASGKTFYTTHLDKKKDGVVTLHDAKTGSKVTLQSSEIKKISKEEYKQALGSTTPPK